MKFFYVSRDDKEELIKATPTIVEEAFIFYV